MRYHQAIINQAVLLSSSPKDVFDVLEARAAKSEDIRSEKNFDEDLELALLDRKDPLINLALAKYGVYEKTIKTIFSRSSGSDDTSKALRYSLLANRASSACIFGDLPTVLFYNDDDKLDYFKNVSEDELNVLFQNPNISDSFVTSFYEGDKVWQALSEELRIVTLDALTYNARLTTPYNDSFMDGYSEFSYGAVFNAIWKLSETLPVNPIYASRLSWIYDKIIVSAFSIKEPLEVAKRWNVDTTDSEDIEREQKNNASGYLSGYQGVRKGLALLALKNSSKLAAELFDSPDLAFRSAVYKTARLSVDQISQGFNKDGELFFNEALHNEELWKDQSTREVLRQVAWAVVDADKHSDLRAANFYNSIREQMAKKHPNWFLDDDEPITSDEPMDSPATKEDLNQIALSITQVTTNLVQEAKQVLNKKVDWIFWFSLGALAVAIFK